MLSELTGMQESDENHRMTKMSFTVETEETDDEEYELVRREYTFSWGEEFDEWEFVRYKERRTSDEPRVSNREWRTVRDMWWSEAEPVNVEIPQLVNDEIAERLGVEEVNIRIP